MNEEMEVVVDEDGGREEQSTTVRGRSEGARDDEIIGNLCIASSRGLMDDKSRMVMGGRIQESRRRANKGVGHCGSMTFFFLLRGWHVTFRESTRFSTVGRLFT